MEWKNAKQQLLKKKTLRKAYEQVDLAYEIGKMVSDARIAKKMTQKSLAKRLGTQQPSIARLERGGYLPSFAFLKNLADIFDTQLLPPRFEFLEAKRSTISHTVKLSSFFNSPYQSGPMITDFVASYSGHKSESIHFWTANNKEGVLYAQSV